jgi:hypothetical protein
MASKGPSHPCVTAYITLHVNIAMKKTWSSVRVPQTQAYLGFFVWQKTCLRLVKFYSAQFAEFVETKAARATCIKATSESSTCTVIPGCRCGLSDRGGGIVSAALRLPCTPRCCSSSTHRAHNPRTLHCQFEQLRSKGSQQERRPWKVCSDAGLSSG